MNSFDSNLLNILRNAKRIVVFTGAGISAESGIPTFRDTLTGLWENFDAQQLATPEAFVADPELVWGWYEWRRGLVMRCLPNAAHKAITAMQANTNNVTVVTQNVDDLHERAGNQNVLHLHGSLHHPYCFDCGNPHNMQQQIPNEPEGGRRLAPPACTKCNGMVRPGVVWFGESLPAQAWQVAQELAAQCDVFFTVGTSSVVYPAAGLPKIAKDSGACVVQVNPHATGIENLLDYNLTGKAGATLSGLVASVWPDSE